MIFKRGRVMATIERASTYRFEANKEILADANIWIFTSDVSNNLKKKELYLQALVNVRNANCRICIDNLILSEFVNRYARIRAKAFGVPNDRFKEFRDSKEFLPIAQEVSDGAKKILETADLIQPGLDTQDTISILDKYAKGGSDFNDQSFIKTCKRKNFKFLTDDRDFAKADISILTENPRLLSIGEVNL